MAKLDITNRLIDEVQKAVEVKEVTIGGKTYTSRQVHRVPLEPVPESLTVHTLQAVIDYVNGGRGSSAESEDGDFEFGQQVLIVIESESEVVVYDWLNDDEARPCLLTAEAITSNFGFGSYHPLEDFIVALQSQFAESEDLLSLISLLTGIVDEASIAYADDGVSQQVTAKTGIARVGNVTVPRLISLLPYRTFVDLDRQPEGRYAFRLRKVEGKPPHCALFEADGGLWRNKAITLIKNMLSAGIDPAKGLIVG